TAVVEGVGDHGCEYMTGGMALVLGPSGRNFAAGMSGGVAYVLDLRPDHVNGELVDVGPLREADLPVVRGLLEDHVRWTQSAVARDLLSTWDEPESSAARFSLVLPRDYQRVLDVRAEAIADGLDLESADVWNRIMEVSRG